MSDLSQSRLEETVGSWSPSVRYLEECDSTNRIAAQWAREGAPDGSIVVTDHQTAGRGRMTRSWVSVPGAGLQFSLVLRPGLAADSIGLLNLVAATALAEAAKGLGLTARLKWPNDLLLLPFHTGARVTGISRSGESELSAAKAAGLLAETLMHAGRLSAVVLGIGVNVNYVEGDFPEELAQSATSFRIAAGRSFDRIDVLAAFLNEFGPRYAGLASARPRGLLDEYRALCDTIGREVRVHLSDRTVDSKAIDVDDSGALLLENGERIVTGDVIHLRRASYP